MRSIKKITLEGLLVNKESSDFELLVVKDKIIGSLFGDPKKQSYNVYKENGKMVVDFSEAPDRYINIKNIKSSYFKPYLKLFDRMLVKFNGYAGDICIESSELDSEFINILINMFPRYRLKNIDPCCVLGICFQDCKFERDTITLSPPEFNPNHLSVSLRINGGSDKLMIESDPKNKINLRDLTIEKISRFIKISNLDVTNRLVLTCFADMGEVILEDVNAKYCVCCGNQKKIENFAVINTSNKPAAVMDSIVIDGSYYIKDLQISYPNLSNPPLRYYFRVDPDYCGEICDFKIIYGKDDKFMPTVFTTTSCYSGILKKYGYSLEEYVKTIRKKFKYIHKYTYIK
jgi:hypothetical protein